jgi:bifunctional non-homologous end joining protein LigD
MPVGWEDLPSVRSGAQWTIKNARDHLSLRTGDPWVKFATTRQSLAAALKQLTRVRTAAPWGRGGADR